LQLRWPTSDSAGRRVRRRGIPSGLGFNAGLVNALYLLEGVAEEAGLDPADIGLEQGWATFE